MDLYTFNLTRLLIICKLIRHIKTSKQELSVNSCECLSNELLLLHIRILPNVQLKSSS